MGLIGLYIHVPFCTQKCPYCDFYSLTDNEMLDRYMNGIINSIHIYASQYKRYADTLYFGGGTPSTLGADRLVCIIKEAKANFGLSQAEITVEVNPSADLESMFGLLAQNGVNRISMGLQSIHRKELELLGRAHTAEQTWNAVKAAHKAGIFNVSLDLMVGIQRQTEQSLKESIAFCEEVGAAHVSAYLLKIEPDTPYGMQRERLVLPNDDETSDLYLTMVAELEKKGFCQYEVSNFAKQNKNGDLCISKHNIKYWKGEEYLGLGPSAHSFMDGKRFYFERSIHRFLQGANPVMDGEGGDKEEYAMLALRLNSGLCNAEWKQKFGEPLPQIYMERAERYEKAGLVNMKADGFALTPKGFLVLNQLILSII